MEESRQPRFILEYLRPPRDDEVETLSLEIAPAAGRLEVGGAGVLPGPTIRTDGWFSSDGNSPRISVPDVRFGDVIRGPTQRTGS